MEDRDQSIQGTIVQIYGEEYRVSSEADVAQVQQIARYVDEKMREVAARSGRLPKTSLAVLVAMEIAAELFRAQEEKERLIQKAYDSLDRINELIEQRSTLVPLTSDWIERRLSRKIPL